MKTILAVVAAVVIALVAYLGYSYYRIQQAATGPAKELVSESITKTGDTWHIAFVSKFDAPLDKVYEIYSHPERSQQLAPENILKSEIVQQEGNTMVIDQVGKLDILPPGFKVQNIRSEYTLYPDEHRLTVKTIGFKLADISSDYKFEPGPDGKSTILKFTQTSQDKSQLVDSLQKGALREQYLLTVRAVNRALGLAPAGDKRQAG